MNYTKLTLGIVFVFLCSMLLSSCIWVGPRRGSRRCYKNAYGRTVCETVHHNRGRGHAHGRRR